MPLYNCQIIDDLGIKKKVIRDATNENRLAVSLKREGYVLLKYHVVREKKPNTFFAISSKVKQNEVIAFLRQFAVMIKAAIPISDAINVIRQQNHSKAFQKVLMQVYYDLQSGVILSEAFAKHKNVFPNFMINMIAIGEESGNLDEVLESLANYYEKDRRIKRKAKSAMVYPIILIVLTVIVFFFITLYVLPQFESTISELGGNVPTLTKVVMAISNFIRDYIVFIVIAALVLFLLLWFFFKKTKTGKYIKDYLKLKIPFIGKVNKNLITARFSRAFIILLGSGMNITDCLENLHRMLSNVLFQNKFNYTIAEVKRGRRIAEAMDNTKMFPPVLIEMINIGERSGNLEEVLKTTMDYFDDCVDSSITRATAALEPIMIVILGFVVGIVILSVLVPIISLMQSI